MLPFVVYYILRHLKLVDAPVNLGDGEDSSLCSCDGSLIMWKSNCATLLSSYHVHITFSFKSQSKELIWCCL